MTDIETIIYNKQFADALKNIAEHPGFCVQSELLICANRGISTERFIILMAAATTPVHGLLHSLVSEKTSNDLTMYYYELMCRLKHIEMKSIIIIYVKASTPKLLQDFIVKHTWHFCNSKNIRIIAEAYKPGVEHFSPFIHEV